MIGRFCENLENLVYNFFRQLWLVLGVKLMEINSNLFSRNPFLAQKNDTMVVEFKN